MTGGFGLALAGASLVVLTIFEMVRRRYIRGRFAVTWTIVGVITALMALAPGALDWAAQVTGVAVPLNLLFFIGFLGLLLILIQLTAEMGRLEKRLLRVAEEAALLRLDTETRGVSNQTEAKTLKSD
ncbi:hypothetical protein GCM10009721_41890 [Terrabacter tumescens]|uniref:DUF2304 domain-containing protein n=1 Tax=Terrabacter tumescens TaxID=60443 RepID=A0ABQ2IJ34_9MICO|nr:DUF2304 domain-containing protein [Terrabacter tumescens]GGN09619.1 hypothetical protein GCM10009721_41890 [Terrabacter tumescens]